MAEPEQKIELPAAQLREAADNQHLYGNILISIGSFIALCALFTLVGNIAVPALWQTNWGMTVAIALTAFLSVFAGITLRRSSKRLRSHLTSPIAEQP